MKIQYPAKIVSGVLKIIHRENFDKEIKATKDMYVKVTIEKQKKKRSNPQNRYYWGVVIPMLKEKFKDLGHHLDSEETHDFVKHKFSRVELVSIETGDILESVKGTSKMTTTEFMDYVVVIREWAAIYMNLRIPDPNEQFLNELRNDTETRN